MKNNRKIGYFYLPEEIINDPAPYQWIFDGLVILKTESEPLMDKVRYFAYCDQFEPVERGCVIPEYRPEVTPDRLSVVWSRV